MRSPCRLCDAPQWAGSHLFLVVACESECILAIVQKRLSIKQTCLILNHTSCSPPRLDLLLRASKSIITKQLTCVRCLQGGWRQEHQGLVSVSNDISRWKRYNQRCPLKLACWRSFGLHELRSASAEQHHLRKGHRCYSNITKRVCHRQ